MNKNRLRILFILFLGVLLVIGCQKHTKHVTPAFYYWKSYFNISKAESDYLKKLNCSKLYVRFFDVDVDELRKIPVPISVIKINSIQLRHLKIIPVVFITNRVFLQANDSELANLPEKVARKIKSICQKAGITSCKEIQFDCDWSINTREQYFQFLKKIKSEFSGSLPLISVTIRLHQIKYPGKTGIPPADLGMLMYYNMGDVKDTKSENSILDFEKAEKYHGFIHDYPMHLDAVLPLYSWAVLFRMGQVIDLINNLDERTIKSDRSFIKKKNNIYVSTSNHYYFSRYFYKNDVLRIEETNIGDLKKAAGLLKKLINSDEISLAFYHLDEAVINKYSYEDLVNIIDIFN
jgi:hypothetical protein